MNAWVTHTCTCTIGALCCCMMLFIVGFRCHLLAKHIVHRKGHTKNVCYIFMYLVMGAWDGSLLLSHCLQSVHWKSLVYLVTNARTMNMIVRAT